MIQCNWTSTAATQRLAARRYFNALRHGETESEAIDAAINYLSARMREEQHPQRAAEIAMMVREYEMLGEPWTPEEPAPETVYPGTEGCQHQHYLPGVTPSGCAYCSGTE